VPPPADTNTPVPPPADTNTPAPPRDTNTPVPPATRTPTPVTPTTVPTPATPLATQTNTPTASNTAVPSTPTATFTLTPVPPTSTATATQTNTPTATATATQTNTPTATPLPTCTANPGTLTIVKLEANNNYTQGPGQQIDFTICIINDTTLPVGIQNVIDTMPSTWQWSNLTCDVSGTNAATVANIACNFPGGPTGGGFSWGHQDNVSPLMMSPGDRIELRIHGRYTAPNPPCNGPETAGIGYKVTLADTSVRTGNAACITVP
jgi:hypothetical protein